MIASSRMHGGLNGKTMLLQALYAAGHATMGHSFLTKLFERLSFYDSVSEPPAVKKGSTKGNAGSGLCE